MCLLFLLDNRLGSIWLHGRDPLLCRSTVCRALCARLSVPSYLCQALCARLSIARRSVPGCLCQALCARLSMPGYLCQALCARLSMPSSQCQAIYARQSMPGYQCQAVCAKLFMPGTLCQALCAKLSVPSALCQAVYARHSVPGYLCRAICARLSVPGLSMSGYLCQAVYVRLSMPGSQCYGRLSVPLKSPVLALHNDFGISSAASSWHLVSQQTAWVDHIYVLPIHLITEPCSLSQNNKQNKTDVCLIFGSFCEDGQRGQIKILLSDLWYLRSNTLPIKPQSNLYVHRAVLGRTSVSWRHCTNPAIVLSLSWIHKTDDSH